MTSCIATYKWKWNLYGTQGSDWNGRYQNSLLSLSSVHQSIESKFARKSNNWIGDSVDSEPSFYKDTQAARRFVCIWQIFAQLRGNCIRMRFVGRTAAGGCNAPNLVSSLGLQWNREVLQWAPVEYHKQVNASSQRLHPSGSMNCRCTM